MRIAWITCVLAGCAYQSGSFTRPIDYAPSRAAGPWPGQHATVDCMDVAVTRRADRSVGPVLGFQFGNRCDHPTTLDFAAATVVGRGANGSERVLTPYDPDRVLHPATLDVRRAGHESLAYVAVRTELQICVDVAGLVQRTPARWLCFGRAPSAAGGAS